MNPQEFLKNTLDELFKKNEGMPVEFRQVDLRALLKQRFGDDACLELDNDEKRSAAVRKFLRFWMKKGAVESLEFGIYSYTMPSREFNELTYEYVIELIETLLSKLTNKQLVESRNYSLSDKMFLYSETMQLIEILNATKDKLNEKHLLDLEDDPAAEAMEESLLKLSDSLSALKK